MESRGVKLNKRCVSVFINVHPLKMSCLMLQAHHQEFHTLIKISRTFQKPPWIFLKATSF